MAVLTIIIALLFEDQLNGYLAGKRMLPGTKSTITKDYFAFVFGQNHAQIFEKNSLTGGTIDEFRTFIKDKTGKKIQQVK